MSPVATKNIPVDLEVYRRLREIKRPDESFSDVLRRVLPKRINLEKWLEEVSRIELAPDARRAIEAKIRSRRVRSRRVR